ncbi:putative branched-chain amino acid transport ATP-binding protein LivG [Candidatus Gugararchaeum adminiculabundum]|nr:putative branched-chain amino acid transport ATP-binding protein LivG [Candidatus Gugararchaeum adminiculabundum]
MGKLEVKNLYVSVEGKEILKGVNLSLQQGEVHALMGPNGSGKSTLSYALMGHPKYKITQGDILLNGESIAKLSPEKRAQKGLFLAFQYPTEVQGISLNRFLLNANKSLGKISDSEKGNPTIKEFLANTKSSAKDLSMDESFLQRYLNVGFSGGEKKLSEILQMSVLKPKFALLDEIDSGLDVDSLKLVGAAINRMRGKDFGALVITHYARILQHVKPDKVHIFIDGKIAQSGGPELAQKIEQKGYEFVK